MFALDLCVGADALRLEPKDKVHAALVSSVAQGPQAPGKVVGTIKPVAHAIREFAGKPIGIQPVCLNAQGGDGQNGSLFCLFVGPPPPATVHVDRSGSTVSNWG